MTDWFWWSCLVTYLPLVMFLGGTIINQYLPTYLPPFTNDSSGQVHVGGGFWSGGGYDAKMTTKCIHYWR